MTVSTASKHSDTRTVVDKEPVYSNELIHTTQSEMTMLNFYTKRLPHISCPGDVVLVLLEDVHRAFCDSEDNHVINRSFRDIWNKITAAAWIAEHGTSSALLLILAGHIHAHPRLPGPRAATQQRPGMCLWAPQREHRLYIHVF
jgi:hypothetical protein